MPFILRNWPTNTKTITVSLKVTSKFAISQTMAFRTQHTEKHRYQERVFFAHVAIASQKINRYQYIICKTKQLLIGLADSPSPLEDVMKNKLTRQPAIIIQVWIYSHRLCDRWRCQCFLPAEIDGFRYGKTAIFKYEWQMTWSSFHCGTLEIVSIQFPVHDASWLSGEWLKLCNTLSDCANQKLNSTPST